MWIGGVNEKGQAEEDLRVSREQMRALAGHLQAVREEERIDIAREIHDELGGADNGKGIEKEKILRSKSLGLLGMRERAQMFGGRFTVTGTPGTGTTVTVEISPVEKRKRDRDQKGAAG